MSHLLCATPTGLSKIWQSLNVSASKQKKKCKSKSQRRDTSSLQFVFCTRMHACCNTFIWNCSKYSKVSRIYLYILVVFQQLPGFMYWAARDQRYNMSIGFCLSVSVPIRASPSRLLLLFKGLAAPSPLKQKEKRDWVRLPPSDQNTSSKTIGGKKNKTLDNKQDTATFQILGILHRTTKPRNIITRIWHARYSLFFLFFWHDWPNISEKFVNLIELWFVATGNFGTRKM